MSEIADSKASFEGDLAVKNRKLKKQSTSNLVMFGHDDSISFELVML